MVTWEMMFQSLKWLSSPRLVCQLFLTALRKTRRSIKIRKRSVSHDISGRRAFLEMLLAVIEWVLRKKSSVLGIVVPPEDASEEALQSVLQFYKNQGEADAKVNFINLFPKLLHAPV